MFPVLERGETASDHFPGDPDPTSLARDGLTRTLLQYLDVLSYRLPVPSLGYGAFFWVEKIDGCESGVRMFTIVYGKAGGSDGERTE